jgi:hypothetical protein
MWYRSHVNQLGGALSGINVNAAIAGLSTVDAIPIVTSAGNLGQDAGLNWAPTTTPLPEGGLLVGQSTQEFILSGRGTDAGVNYGVPYLKSNTENSFTALDVFPDGSPAAGNIGNSWFDVCSNDLSPLNTIAWQCNVIGTGGQVWSTGNGTITSIVLNGTTAVVTTSIPHNLVAGSTTFFCESVTNNLPFPTDPGSTYGTITAATTYTWTWDTGRTAGTYTTGQTCYIIGANYLGAHYSVGTGPPIYIGGAQVYLQSRVGTTSTLFAAFADGVFKADSGGVVKVNWTNPTFRLSSDQILGFGSGTDANAGSTDTGISRDAAGVLDIGTGAAKNVAGSLKLLAVATVPVATSALPACVATTGTAWRASVNDAVTPALGVVLTGGGAIFANVHCSLTTGTYLVDGI